MIINSVIAGGGTPQDLTTGSTITVLSVSGDTITITRGTETQTATVSATGSVSFTVKTSGIWVVAVTVGGVLYNKDIVVVGEDNTTYSIDMKTAYIYDNGRINHRWGGDMSRPSGLYMTSGSRTYNNTGTVTFDESSILLTDNSDKLSCAANNTAVRYSAFARMHIKYTTNASSGIGIRLMSSLSGDVSGDISKSTTALSSGTKVTTTVSLSGVSGTSGYVGVSAVNGRTLTIHQIWFTRT